MRGETRGTRGAPPSRGLRVAVLALACAVHLVVLYLPRAPSIGPSGVRLDLLVHAAVFAGVALAAVRAGLGWLSPRLVAVVLVAEAVVSEVVQGLWLPERSGDATDAVADVVGTVLGLWLGLRLGARALRRGGPAPADARVPT